MRTLAIPGPSYTPEPMLCPRPLQPVPERLGLLVDEMRLAQIELGLSRLHRARNDEYAWLKAENWREVMRDPSQLDPAIRAYLQAERCAMNQRACHLNAG